MRQTILICTAILSVLIASCTTSPYFQQQSNVPNMQWRYSFQPTFTINISDTNQRYASYLIIRHDEAYPFSNIWVKLKVKTPGSKTFNEEYKIEKSLADAEGKWLGRGMSGIWEHRIPFTTKEKIIFNQKGTYQIQVAQIMRQDPLPSIINVGFRVEKIGTK